MKKHYHTSDNTILCKQNFKNTIIALSRFSYKLGDHYNCKNCEKILNKHLNENNNKCNSFEKLGYDTVCHWRDGDKCNCIDDCNFKF